MLSQPLGLTRSNTWSPAFGDDLLFEKARQRAKLFEEAIALDQGRMREGLSAIARLEGSASALLAHYKPSGGGRPTNWQASFVAHLGRIWLRLTHSIPSVASNAPFAEFVSAAAYTVRGDEAEELKWDHVIRGPPKAYLDEHKLPRFVV